MIKNNTPDLKRFNEILKDGKFDPTSPAFDSSSPIDDRNRREFVREEGKNHSTKLSVEELQMAAIIRSKQQQIARIIRETRVSEHIDPAIFADPTSMRGEQLKGLLTLVTSNHKEVKAGEDEESNSLLKNLKGLLNRCKSLFGKKKCCYENKPLIAAPVDPLINKAITNIAVQELGELTPLMLRNIDSKFVVDPDNPNRRKLQEKTIMV